MCRAGRQRAGGARTDESGEELAHQAGRKATSAPCLSVCCRFNMRNGDARGFFYTTVTQGL